MRNITILCLLLMTISVNLCAQDDKKIVELISLYDSGNYGEVAKKGEKLMGHDDYRKHPFSYLYSSMAYYQMYLDPGKHDAGTKDSKYPTPLKNAQKYLAKFHKVEIKAGKYYPDYEKDYDMFNEFSLNIASATTKKAQSYFLDNKASKAVGVYKTGLKAVPNEPVLLLWQGVCEVTMKNTLEGEKNIFLALDTIDEGFTPSDATKGSLTKGLLLAEEYLTSKGLSQKANKAKTLAELFKKYDTYDEIKTDFENPEIPSNIPTEKKIDDLLFLYVDEKYEDAAYKGQNLMQSEKYSKHPAPYIYTAMSYFEMSKRPGKYDVGEKDSKYPKPLKDAQKYLAKYNKIKKKSKKYFPYYEQDIDEVNEFYEAIGDTTNKIGQHFFLNEDYRKAAGFYKSGVKSVPNDPVLLLWQGVCEIKSKNTTEGSKTVLAALNRIDENFKPFERTGGVLAHGLLLTEEYLRSSGNSESANKAKKLIDVFKKYDPDELDKKKMEERKEKAKKDDKVMRKFFSDEEDEDNKNKKGKVIFEGDSDAKENGSKSADDELDQLEKEATGGGK